MIYVSYAHGYKAGGANPPPTAIITYGSVAAEGRLDNYAIFPRTFEPEYVDAFEIGTKNTLFGGALTVNTAAFYYDYKNYQVSEIVERSALNRNFDVEAWGLEIEADWRPVENLLLSFKGGYERTRIADGEQAIDLMDRAAGDPDWTVLRPFPASPSNCVVPTWLLTWKDEIFRGADDWGICTPIINGLDPVTWLPYVANPTVKSGPGGSPPTSLFDTWSGGRFPAGHFIGYPGYDPASANNSTGIHKDLGGNELPNAPQFTATIAADYKVPISDNWMLALHTDFHWQSESWWRVFNDLEYNRLKEYYTMNLAAILTNEERGWNIMAYVKNVTNETAITGAFLFSDDIGLPTNVFLTEPRLYGLRVTKAWTGGPLLGSFGGRHDGPYPFTVELSGQAQRHEAPYQTIEPSFASAFSDGIDPLDTQNQELDWGDGREVRLTYRPGGAWSLSLGGRFGKTNGYAESFKSEFADETCFTLEVPSYQISCTGPQSYGSEYNYSDTFVRNAERHTVVDFEVGRDVGLGAFDDAGFISKVGLGLRYAQFQSKTNAHILGTPDWDLPERTVYKYAPFAWTKYDTYHTEHEAKITAEREFEGVGPVLSWDASHALIGNDDVGHIKADVSLGGGVLFGKQRTRVTGSEVDDYFEVSFNYGQFIDPTVRTTTPIDFNRSDSVTVPVVDISLGLSYEIDRMSLSAGYRWERYFDAIDGGYDKQESHDRTIDGPYFKISVGFGG